METPDFKLRIDAHALVQLGEQLITDDEQALLELVKNSYDADADWSRITILSNYVPILEVDEVPSEAVGMIEIADNGTGMDRKGIEDGWLVISLSLKRNQKRLGKRTKKHNRLPLGDKGLGRLGTMKLGKYLSVETYNSPTDEGWRVTFQWSDVKSGMLLDQVPISYKRIPPSGQTGTTVRIFGLKELESWKTKKKKERLQRKLSGLISPFERENNFEVSLTWDHRSLDLTQISGALRNTATMRFSYDWDGLRLKLEGKLKLIWFRKKNEGYDQFIAKDEGKALLKVLQSKDNLKEYAIEKSQDSSWFIVIRKEVPSSDVQFVVNDAVDPGPFSGAIDYFDLDTDIQLPKNLFQNANDYRALIKELAQVYVYRDEFGIRMPNDWLRLGAAWTSGAGSYSLKPSNVIGTFKISVFGNPKLEEKSDREGFTENEAWRGFFLLATAITKDINFALNRSGKASVQFLNESTGVHASEEVSASNYGTLLGQLESLLATSEGLNRHFTEQAKNRVYSLRKVEGQTRLVFLNLKESDEKRAKAQELLDAIENLQRDFNADADKISELIKVLASQKQLPSIIRRRIDDFEERYMLLYEMVGVGLSAQALAHDVPAMLHHLEDQTKILSKLVKARDFDKLANTTAEMATGIQTVEQMVDFVRPMLKGRRLSRRKAKISDFVRSFFELRGARLLAKGIKWQVEEDGMRDFEIGFNPGRFTQILDNLTTNSEYWIQHHLGSNNKNGRITVEIRDPELIFSDNGKGVRPDLEQSLFELFTSGKDGDEGNGLGLFITNQLLLRDNCSIALDSLRNEHNRLYRFAINFSGAKK